MMASERLTKEQEDARILRICEEHVNAHREEFNKTRILQYHDPARHGSSFDKGERAEGGCSGNEAGKVIHLCTEHIGFTSTGILRIRPALVRPADYAFLALEDDNMRQAAVIVDKRNLSRIIEGLQEFLCAWEAKG